MQHSAASKPYYSPGLGGAKNCVRCRFFITGPAFLGGLVARFNAEVPSDNTGSLTRAYERRDRVLDEGDGIAHIWHAIYWLVERCRATLTAPTEGKQQVKLVLAGGVEDLQAALSECSE